MICMQEVVRRQAGGDIMQNLKQRQVSHRQIAAKYNKELQILRQIAGETKFNKETSITLTNCRRNV